MSTTAEGARKAKVPYVSPTVTSLGAAVENTMGGSTGNVVEPYSESLSWTTGGGG
jgi:hypothetical protein